ncbi:energy-coupling factor transporter transmembrane protein EcfT [Paenibacillus sp. LMG 31459]|jgi:energy-coupling factor transport system permease protein|uniref:Energy-coupling factor transporter transmembrane protein EcfT n=1 Tax=Paenibacillus phytohabitans TaxID=2654978 RepID=A0ABX1YQU7_9BACL|nr:energy-coupling factor transporter transmembrane component T [Paenibacillus phytohabitans]NOU83442.1 energy-coupling factor transporter transmembrane protein EcfT [Paenibacillus phytohabitans]
MNSGFRSMHPAVALLYYAGLLLFALLGLHPLFLVTEIAGLLALLLLQGQGKALLRGLPFMLLMGGSVAVLNPLFSHRGAHILFYWLDQPITLEAVLYGLIMMTVLLTIFIWFISYNYTVTTDKFMYLFAAAAPRTALLTLMALRFVPLFQRRLRQITLIQRLRGVDVRTGSLRKRMQDGMTLLKVLLTWSLEEALQTGDSMTARGYGVAKRSTYSIYKPDRQDKLILLVLTLSGMIALFFWLQGYGTLEIYPRMKSMDFGWQDAVMYGSFCLFVLLPAGLEGKEKWLWRSSKRNKYPSAILKKTGTRSMSSRSQ